MNGLCKYVRLTNLAKFCRFVAMKKILCIVMIVFAAIADAGAQWAMPRLSVAHVRTRPAHGAEMSTQALMGMPLRVVDDGGQWIKVEMPDGYTGYIRSNSLVRLSDSEMAAWRRADRVAVVSVDENKVYADTVSGTVVSDVVDGNILQTSGNYGRWTAVMLPDGRRGWVDSSVVEPIGSWASQKPDADSVLRFAARHLGAPYTWGGNSSKGMDCSGLVKMAFFHHGLILRRDAYQQAEWGAVVSPDSLRPGDLVFYGDRKSGHIDHVAIYVGDDRVIESAGLVRYGTPACGERFILARRVLGQPDSAGIIPVRSHGWYF